MEIYTTTAADGRTLELEIVQAAPYGFAVNFHQMDECVGKLYFDGEGYRTTAGELEINLQDGEKKLGTFADKWEAIAAIVANLSAYLDAHDEPAHDPADATELLMDELDPEVYGEHYSPAALRDILRRAAYDMGITDRRAHENMLPAIAHKAADMIREEMEPEMRKWFKSDLAEMLAVEGWTVDHRGTSFEHGALGSFSMGIESESIRVYASRSGGGLVETFVLNRNRTSAERLARIIGAVFE
ncbi:hypothetical protein PBI_ANDREW_30 [Arthrobacter phage Andrew]|uniref:Uncharacterized protein n=1 Tax=Arthrobacter phage Andrew TaxID=2419946 RepID=A0A3G2KD71_9CAUD|nr:hypothetical protein HOU53_gp30 [Arthrobacter phage Andrew]AYN56845.1 hypothetical protein PBI_ANDREW_30 [Arthrobacter phage Andrew]